MAPDASADLALSPEIGSADAAAADAGVPGSTKATTCDGMVRFATPLQLVDFNSRQASFSPSAEHLALISYVEDAPGELVVVELPSARRTTLAGDVSSARWLDQRSLLAVISVFGLKPLPHPFQPGGYDLDRFDLITSRRVSLARRACGHRVSPLGRRLAAVTECVGGRGALRLVGLDGAPSEEEPIAEDVSHDVQWSADGELLAFYSGAGFASCSGALWLYDTATREVRQVADGATAARFVAGGALVFDRCGDVGQLRAHYPRERRTVSLGATLSWRWQSGSCSTQSYHVTPDGRWLVGGVRGDGGAQQLVAVDLDGGGQRLLAGDLVTNGAPTVALADGGRRLVYTRPAEEFGVALATLATDQILGQPVSLTDTLANGGPFAVSPTGDEVAYLERGPNRLEIKAAPLTGQPARGVYRPALERQPAVSQSPPRYLPDGRAMVWAGRAAGRLAYIPRGAGAATVIGTLEPTIPLGCGGFDVDASGCLAVYNDLGGGTTLVKLPGDGLRGGSAN